MRHLTTAQKVRLWFIVGSEALSAILIIAALTSLNYSPYLNVTVASGDTTGVIAWILISQVAVVTLGIITFVRFLHPKAPAQTWPQGPPQPQGAPYGYNSPQYPSGPAQPPQPPQGA
jgi:hypothetical protein